MFNPSYQDKINAINIAKSVGLDHCGGCLIGMGEPVQDRIDVAFEIKKYGGSSMPFNVFVQFEGIGIHNTSLPVLEILKTQSIYRLIMPRKDIISSGGRVKNFNELHPLALIATNGLVMSSYLTGQDRNPAQDEQMIRDLGLAI